MRKLIGLLLLMSTVILAQRGGPGPGNRPLASLKSVAPPSPVGLQRYVKDQNALIALGKTFFWDMQVGSDGSTACATCHFHAGADHRLQNQLSGTDATLNHVLTSNDFPFHQFANPASNRSTLVRNRQQVAGSMGMIEKAFSSVQPGAATDAAVVVSSSSPFHVNGVQLRQVTGRNAPSVINAAYNVRNFWDGRASDIFTGVTPFGDSDHGLNAVVFSNGALLAETVRLEGSSLASQATGPALNSVEMSWANRAWFQLGRKMLSLPPLSRQKVAADDSVLGAMANPGGNGLRSEWSYAALIAAAFRDEYWSASKPDGDGQTQMERNFPLYWGLAIQAYETTLVANDSRVDRFFEGQTSALTALEQQGLQEFQGNDGQCTNCHDGPETTAAAVPPTTGAPVPFPGFFRIGVTPIAADIGAGGQDGFGQPLQPAAGAAANGTFKAPGLRNVEFTGPYFHDGGQGTLEQVLLFYARNGDFPNDGNLGPGIGAIRLNQGEQNAIVAFLKALSDDRVRFQKAPFDHPSLCVPNGHVEQAGGQLALDGAQAGVVALDRWALVPEVGRSGSAVPLQTFDELLRGVGSDGSRANNMTIACSPAAGISLSGGGSASSSTAGSASVATPGFARVAVTSGTAPYGTALFSLRQNGYVVSEAGVPASPPTRNVRLFVDYRNGVPAGIGSLSINTGVAIANVSGAAATLAFTLRDSSGVSVATGQSSLAAGAHVTGFVDQLSRIAPDFVFPRPFSATQTGSLEISSSMPVSVVALRLTVNQRGETLLTSTPISDLGVTPNNSPLLFPQSADGGGYKTSVVLLNTSAAQETGSIGLFDDAGALVSEPGSYSIPAGGTTVFEVAGSGTVTRTGWIRVSPASGSAPAGSAIFSYSPAGILITETGVAPALETTSARLFIDRSGGHDTGVALANAGAAAAAITVRAFQADGSTPAGTGTATLTLGARGHTAKFVGEVIAGLESGFTGVLEISSPAPFAAVTLRSLTNGRGDFLLTTFPIADTTRPAPSPLVFPQIADGGGYSTQFIFVSAKETSTLSLDFSWDN